MTMINDELFGELEYKNNFWRGEMTIKMFNFKNKILLSVDAHEDADFSITQRDAFLNFIQDMNQIMGEAEKEVYEYYSENVDEYREMLENESLANKISPKIDIMGPYSVRDFRLRVNDFEFYPDIEIYDEFECDKQIFFEVSESALMSMSIELNEKKNSLVYYYDIQFATSL